MCGLLSVAVSRGYSLVVALRLLTGVASLVVEPWFLGEQASVVVTRGLSHCGSWAPEHRLSSFGTWAYLTYGMWELPGSGIKPTSFELTGGCFYQCASREAHLLIFEK